jgi:hypothetical protein
MPVHLRDLMRRCRHLPISEQVANLNQVLRGYYAYYGIGGNFRACNGCTGSSSATGTRCSAAAAAKAVSGGRFPIGSWRGGRCSEHA